jgi:signal transduction histidine kinase
MGLPLRLLLLNHSDDDGALVLQELRRSIYDPIYIQVDTLAAFQSALHRQPWDVILANEGLPHLPVLDALNLLQQTGLDLPFLVISETLSDDSVRVYMEAGAQDYFLKTQLVRLGPAIARELRAAALRRSKQQTDLLLQQTLHDVDRLVQQRVHDYETLKQMKDEFIAIISHELRTPLTSLQGSIDLLLHSQLGQLSHRGQRMLEIAANNTERLVQLINTIFDLQHFASNDTALESQVYDIHPIIEAALTTLTPVAQQAGVRLVSTLFSVPLWGDRDRILQMLLHLLSNAIKFSARGSTIYVMLEVIDQPHSLPHPLAASLSLPYLLIRIQDEGQGIPANQLALIFEEFRQVDASDTRRQGGAGLGLALCRTIAHQHQGNLWAESQPGQGSTFYLALPIQPDGIKDTEVRDVVEIPCDSQTSISY